MPTHCGIPYCTKKGYRKDDGNKVFHFVFPTEKTLQKKWIHAIRREEGKYFTIKTSTKVCSKHFREYELKKSLARKMYLRPNAVRSLFLWTRTSPRKRKAPTLRELESARKSSTIISDNTNEENIMDVSDNDSTSDEYMSWSSSFLS